MERTTLVQVAINMVMHVGKGNDYFAAKILCIDKFVILLITLLSKCHYVANAFGWGGSVALWEKTK